MEALYQLSYGPGAPQDTPRLHETAERSESHRGGADTPRYARSPMTATARADESTPAYRYNARLAGEIEARWQDYWEEHRTFWTPNPSGPLADGFERMEGREEALRARHVPVPEWCRPPRRSPARLHRHRRVRAVPAHERPQRAARARLRRVRAPGRAVRARDGPAPARRRPRPTSPTCAASCARSAWVTTRVAASRPPMSRTTGGRSGSSSRSSTPGTTTTPTGRVRSPSSSPSSSRAPTAVAVPPTRAADRGPSSTNGPAVRSSTRTGSRTSTRRWSTGARGSAPCSPTRR